MAQKIGKCRKTCQFSQKNSFFKRMSTGKSQITAGKPPKTTKTNKLLCWTWTSWPTPSWTFKLECALDSWQTHKVEIFRIRTLAELLSWQSLIWPAARQQSRSPRMSCQTSPFWSLRWLKICWMRFFQMGSHYRCLMVSILLSHNFIRDYLALIGHRISVPLKVFELRTKITYFHGFLSKSRI